MLAVFAVSTESIDRRKMPIAMVPYKMPARTRAPEPENRSIPYVGIGKTSHRPTFRNVRRAQSLASFEVNKPSLRAFRSHSNFKMAKIWSYLA